MGRRRFHFRYFFHWSDLEISPASSQPMWLLGDVLDFLSNSRFPIPLLGIPIWGLIILYFQFWNRYYPYLSTSPTGSYRRAPNKKAATDPFV